MHKRFRAVRAVLLVVLTVVLTSPVALAQSSETSAMPPVYKQLRYDEDYAYL
jgi:hypothetical protein